MANLKERPIVPSPEDMDPRDEQELADRLREQMVAAYKSELENKIEEIGGDLGVDGDSESALEEVGAKGEGDSPSEEKADRGYSKRREQKYNKASADFFDFPEEKVEKKYGQPSEDYDRRRGIERQYEVGRLAGELSKEIDRILKIAKGELPDSFFDRAVELAREYKSLGLGHCENFHRPDGALQSSQLFALISHPEFIRDPRCVGVMEELADLEDSEPWTFSMYVDYELFTAEDGKEKGRYVLREGFNSGHLPTFQKLIEDDRLWTGKSTEMRRVFFTSIAEAVGKLADENRAETLPLRLELLRRTCQYGGRYGGPSSEMLYPLVYTFTTEEDKKALEELVESSPPDSKIREVAQRILDGGYENVAWAI